MTSSHRDRDDQFQRVGSASGVSSSLLSQSGGSLEILVGGTFCDRFVQVSHPGAYFLNVYLFKFLLITIHLAIVPLDQRSYSTAAFEDAQPSSSAIVIKTEITSK